LNIYVESSALLAWLFREPGAARVETIIDGADIIATSDLALVECDRAIHRQAALGRLSSEEGARLADDLASEAASWIVLEFTPKIVERARQPFPGEPIRSLDALHVAFALQVRQEQPNIAILTLDDRIRRVGASLGFAICPTDATTNPP
jgi:predicted nucleic acid-binding protein